MKRAPFRAAVLFRGSTIPIFLAVGTCHDAGAPPSARPDARDTTPTAVEFVPTVSDSTTLVIDATVRRLNIEGGCWALVEGNDDAALVNRARYQPINLSDEFRHDGLKVRVAMRVRSGIVSICMIGPIVDVVWIQSR